MTQKNSRSTQKAGFNAPTSSDEHPCSVLVYKKIEFSSSTAITRTAALPLETPIILRYPKNYENKPCRGVSIRSKAG